VLANPLELRGRHRVNNMNPEADIGRRMGKQHD
jgi:hypothetical protein